MPPQDDAAAAQREYMRQYRAKNRERINQQHREWNRKHPEAVREYRLRYWLKKFNASFSPDG